MSDLKLLYKYCTEAGFSPLAQSEPAESAAAFTLAKEDGTTVCLLQAADLNQMDDSICRFLQNQELERAAVLNPMYSSVWVIFIRIGGTPSFENAEAFFGQSPYAIYWYLDKNEKKIIVSPDQPDDVMGLKAAVTDAMEEMKDITPQPPVKTDNPVPQPVLEAYESARTNRPLKKRSVSVPQGNQAPFITIVLASVNITMMVLMYLQGFAATPVPVAIRFGAIHPGLIWGAGEYYRLFTAMFIHFSWTHLFFNVAGIFIFGTRIERYFGRIAYLSIFIFTGLTASVASLLLTQGVSAGASGAVYGLLGAAFAYTRYTKRPMDMINYHIILVYIIMGLSMGFVIPGIDHFGHVGGLISGMIIGRVAVGLMDNG